MPLWTKTAQDDRDGCQIEEAGSFLTRLSIRSSLILGLGAMSGVMALSVLAALFVSSSVISSVGEILEVQLPATVNTFRVARAAEALGASGIPLAFLSTANEREVAFHRVDTALKTLKQSQASLQKAAEGNDEELGSLLSELTDNLQRMRDIVDERIGLKLLQRGAREMLLANLLAFQQHLTYRVRILEGDSDVIHSLMSQPFPPVDRIAKMASQLTLLLPVARFYGEIEAVNGRLLAASQDATLPTLNLSLQVLNASLESIEVTLERFPESLARELAQPFADLKQLVRGEDGLIRLRGRELRLNEESLALNRVNEQILKRVGAATDNMVRSGLDAVSRTGLEVDVTRRRYFLFLVITTGLGLVGVALLMHFQIDRHVIARLSWLSSAMQDVASGRMDVSLPPAGCSELGRLGAALHLFRETAIEARERECALHASNIRVEQALALVEQKAAELEIANAMLQELSVRDPLTGLFNRRRFDQSLTSEWARAGHGGKPLALFVLDLDYFKQYNDRYGHQAGDACLKQVGSILQNHARRAGDVAARFGGEEFCLICPYTNNEQAESIAQSLRQSVFDQALPHEDSPFDVVTVSIGYIVVTPDARCTSENLLQLADQALYKAKNKGRNCIQFSEAPLGVA